MSTKLKVVVVLIVIQFDFRWNFQGKTCSLNNLLFILILFEKRPKMVDTCTTNHDHNDIIILLGIIMSINHYQYEYLLKLW